MVQPETLRAWMLNRTNGRTYEVIKEVAPLFNLITVTCINGSINAPRVQVRVSVFGDDDERATKFYHAKIKEKQTEKKDKGKYEYCN
jgi:hypothetical protein